jgi:uncharacterized membrane protein YkvA (DUF1232 family)
LGFGGPSDNLNVLKRMFTVNMNKNIIKLSLLTRLFQDLKLLFPLIKDYWKGTYRKVSARSTIIFMVALAYIVSPIDLIPDYILGFGQIDDVFILGLALNFLEKDLTKYREWKDKNG